MKSVTHKHKFHAKPTLYDNIRFDSKKESQRYAELKQLQTQGEVVFFLRQIPLYLPGNIRYVCDFQIFWANGTVTFEDVKGYRTDTYKIKKKQVEAIYPIEITEV